MNEELDGNDKVDADGINCDEEILYRDLTLKEVDSLASLVVVIHHDVGDHMVDNNSGPGLVILGNGNDNIPVGDLVLVHDDDEGDHGNVDVIVGVALLPFRLSSPRHEEGVKPGHVIALPHGSDGHAGSRRHLFCHVDHPLCFSSRSQTFFSFSSSRDVDLVHLPSHFVHLPRYL